MGLFNDYSIERLRNKINILLKEPLRENIYPLFFKEGQLFLLVNSRDVMYMLNSIKEEIIEKLKEFGVTSIRFKIGKVKKTYKKININNKKKVNSNVEIPPELLLLVNSKIKDKDLKNSILNAIKSWNFYH